MASDQSIEHLRAAAEAAGSDFPIHAESTLADIALQAFLAAPQIFMRHAERAQIAVLTSFHHYAGDPPPCCPAKPPFINASTIQSIKDDIDSWLLAQRGNDNLGRVTQVEWHKVGAEDWFLVRRGDSFVRLPMVEGGTFHVRHFRPARDLVVIYSHEWDELRAHARTQGERKMLRRIFGRRLFERADYFAKEPAFTLDPLRALGLDALRSALGTGIESVTLTRLLVRSRDEHCAAIEWRADDVFAFASANNHLLFPGDTEPVSAAFKVRFTGDSKPRSVCLRVGNRLRLSRHCDAALFHRWMAENGYRPRSLRQPEGIAIAA